MGVQLNVKRVAKVSTISVFSFHQLLTIEEEEVAEAAEVKPKQAFWLLDEKLALCIECEKLVKAEKKMSMKEFCRMVENRVGKLLQPSQLWRWGNNIGKIWDTLNNTRKKKSRVSINIGRKSRLELYKDEILSYVETMQEQGKTVSTRLVAARAKCLDKSLHCMNCYTLFAIIWCFLVSNGRVLCVVTHQSQEDPQKKADTAVAGSSHNKTGTNATLLTWIRLLMIPMTLLREHTQRRD